MKPAPVPKATLDDLEAWISSVRASLRIMEITDDGPGGPQPRMIRHALKEIEKLFCLKAEP